MFYHYLAFSVILGIVLYHNFCLKEQMEEWKVKALEFEYKKKWEYAAYLVDKLEKCSPTDLDLAKQKKELTSKFWIGWRDPPGVKWRSSVYYQMLCCFEDAIAAEADNLLCRLEEQGGVIQ